MDQIQKSIGLIRNMVRDIQKDYVEWIQKSPSRASDIETSVKIISYLLHGRFKNSTILPELLYCSSNLLAFWHDRLLNAEAEKRARSTYERGGYENKSPRDSQILRIKSTLTILEYFEVFLEVSARQLWGDVGRWLVILIVQSIKTGLKAALLFHYKIGVIESPALQPCHRRKNGSDPNASAPNLVFVLKHSGRVVRKIHAAPPLAYRNWKLPSVPSISVVSHDLPPMRLLAEVIHIMRPLSHLLCLSIWGTKSWKPWAMGLSMDITSLQLHGQPTRFRQQEKNELTRRTYALLYYLIRSPFYDRYTKHRLLTSLMFLSGKIPLVGHLCYTIAQAIPEWQDTYSYVWNDS